MLLPEREDPQGNKQQTLPSPSHSLSPAWGTRAPAELLQEQLKHGKGPFLSLAAPLCHLLSSVGCMKIAFIAN